MDYQLMAGWFDLLATNKDAFEAIDVILGIFVILLIAPIIWVTKRFLKWTRPHLSMPKEDAPEATKTDNSKPKLENQSNNACGSGCKYHPQSHEWGGSGWRKDIGKR